MEAERAELDRLELLRLRAQVEGEVIPPGNGGEPAGGAGLDLARGRLIARQFQRGELGPVHASFSAPLAAQMPLDELQSMWDRVQLLLGNETELLDETVVPGPNFRLYTRTARFERYAGAIDFVVQLTQQREIAGIEFRMSEQAHGGP
jgi:hypothetical protein